MLHWFHITLFFVAGHTKCSVPSVLHTAMCQQNLFPAKFGSLQHFHISLSGEQGEVEILRAYCGISSECYYKLSLHKPHPGCLYIERPCGLIYTWSSVCYEEHLHLKDHIIYITGLLFSLFYIWYLNMLSVVGQTLEGHVPPCQHT